MVCSSWIVGKFHNFTVKICLGIHALLWMCSRYSTQCIETQCFPPSEEFLGHQGDTDFQKAGSLAESVVCNREEIMYQCTAWAAVSVLTVPGARVHSSSALSTALRPRWPRWPENRLRAGNLLIAESGKDKLGRLHYAQPKHSMSLCPYSKKHKN